jgi:hypothetical protein
VIPTSTATPIAISVPQSTKVTPPSIPTTSDAPVRAGGSGISAGTYSTNVITIASLQSGSEYFLNSATLSIGGSAGTIGNEIISTGSSGLEIISGTGTSALDLARYILSRLGIVVTQAIPTAAAATIP